MGHFVLGGESGVGVQTSGRSVLIIDEDRVFSEALAHSFGKQGFTVEVAGSTEVAAGILASRPIEIIVSEQRLGHKTILEELAALRDSTPKSRIVIATAYPSIAAATQSVKSGIDCYLPKPVNASLILDNLKGSSPPAAPAWPSLDLTIWEYINSVFVTAGSMSEAARRLRLDRRSLRRMLAKHPPAR